MHSDDFYHWSQALPIRYQMPNPSNATEFEDAVGPAPGIPIQGSAQLVELRNPVENWTGVTNSARRRKLQNRLNQRAKRTFISPAQLSVDWSSSLTS